MPSPRDLEPAVSIHDKIVAVQRKNAAASRTRERLERPSSVNTKRRPPSPSPMAASPSSQQLPVIPAEACHHSHTSRAHTERDRSTRQHNQEQESTPRPQGRSLQVPTGTIPTRRFAGSQLTDEPDDINLHSNPHPRSHTHHHRENSGNHQRQLFDPRKDDPVRFQTSVFNRPTPISKSSADTFVSASSTSASSYAHSIGSSFTLTSNSTGTSGSSSGGPNVPKEEGESGNAFVFQLKKLYREITALEGKLVAEQYGGDDDEPRFKLQAREHPIDAIPDDRYLKMINDHKRLADMMQKLMSMTLSPQVPTSVHSISSKYNIPTRLWGNAFHHALQTLRKASVASDTALEHLNDFIFWAYSFYTSLVEDPQVETFKAAWLEALGDLARYRMAVATFNPSPDSFKQPIQLSLSNVDDAEDVEGSANPSVGAHAAQSLEVEPESEQWRQTARRWYAQGLQETPGTGKLHHHLGLLSRDVRHEELRAVYHFAKSLTVTHPFLTSRETILSLFSIDLQRRRSLADASSKDLFILLHGMLFTHIDLDDFVPTMDRFLERLLLDNAYQESNPNSSFWEERDWIIMGVVNIASVLEYGKPGGRLKSAIIPNPAGQFAEDQKENDVKVLVQRSRDLRVDDHDVQSMDIDGSITLTNGEPTHLSSSPSDCLDEPAAFRMALHLTFSIFSHAICHPYRRATPFARPSLNPYIDIVLTFIAASFRHSRVIELLERAFPWQELVDFLNTAPQHLQIVEVGSGSRITQGCLPLPEDWCLRGMEWAARRTYERGFWRTDAGLGGEQPVLNLEEVVGNATDGIIEDDEDEDANLHHRERGENTKRWIRILRACTAISRAVDGLVWDKETRAWRICGQLATKVVSWVEEQRIRSAEEQRRRDRQWSRGDVAETELEEEEEAEGDDDDDDDDPEDGVEVKSLKARRRYLRHLLRSSDYHHLSPAKPRARHTKSNKPRGAPLKLVPGYTVLVVDTNILLSLFSEFSALVESCRWTVIVPLAVITELDGISSNEDELGSVASSAVSFIVSHVRSHGISLKVQTSKGNYLSTLNVRSEEFQFSPEEGSWDRNIDDLVIRAAVWQKDHWVDRSRLLKQSPDLPIDSLASKVTLLSFDRNLRLKARARDVDAADQQQLAAILV